MWSGGRVRQPFERIEVQGPDVVAFHPQPNENAWLLGYAAICDGSLTTQERVGMVGARGVERIELISSANVPGLHQFGP